MRLRDQEMKLPAERNQVLWNGEAAGAVRDRERMTVKGRGLYRLPDAPAAIFELNDAVRVGCPALVV